jgi:hypothetical protein
VSLQKWLDETMETLNSPHLVDAKACGPSAGRFSGQSKPNQFGNSSLRPKLLALRYESNTTTMNVPTEALAWRSSGKPRDAHSAVLINISGLCLSFLVL